MTLKIAIPDELAEELGSCGQSVNAWVEAELAASFYEEHMISLGRAADISGMRRQDFEALLAKRHTARDYNSHDLAADLGWPA